ncbi:MAG: GWxTD domain-containing protein [Gemmatimonadota bacterium]|nr:GWxTD domain-containing protein [Gemmatimonadota bacterium]
MPPRRALPLLGFALGCLTLAPHSADAQRRRELAPTLDSLYRQAQAALAHGDSAHGIDLLEQVQRRAPRFPGAFFDHGAILARRSEMGLAPDDVIRRHRASEKLERALDLDPNNPRYLLELGRLRLKTPFLRIEAERLFAKAQRAARDAGDPALLATIEYELGLVAARRFNALRHRRILTGTTTALDLDAAVNDWHYIRDFLEQRTAPVTEAGELDRLTAEEHFHAALAADSTHGGAAADLLALLYESDRTEEMLPLATTLARRQPRAPRTWLAYGLALYATDQLAESASAFDSALALLPEPTRDALLDVTQWLRPDDAARLAGLPAEVRAATALAWWRSADPLALTPVNEARVTLLARAAYADLRFTSEEAGLAGWRTDRGQIWMRYGRPAVIASFAPETQETNGAESTARILTVWWYPATSLRFVFRGPPAINAAGFAGNFRAYADNARRIIPMRLDDAHAALRLDTVAVQVARFRSSAGARVELFAQWPTDRMLADVELTPALVEGGFAFGEGAAYRTPRMIRDTLHLPAGRHARAVSRQWARTVHRAGAYAYRIEARQPDTGRGARGDGTVDLSPAEAAPIGAPGRFDISDLVIADRIVARDAVSVPDTAAGPPARVAATREAFSIEANAAMRFALRDTVALYWETYGATVDTAGVARLRVRVTVRILSIDRGRAFTARVLGGLADAVGLSAVGEETVSLAYERAVAVGTMAPHHLALGLGDAPAGQYAVTVDVTDLGGRRTARTERTITLERAAP